MPLITNYGGILQAYALKTFLEKEGHSVEFFELDRRIHRAWWKVCLLVIFRSIKKYILRKPYIIVHYERDRNRSVNEEAVTGKHIRPFIERNFKIRTVAKYSDIKEGDYIAIIVGSDQVWRHYYSRTLMGSTPATYLDFTKGWNIKRIAYAASFGVSWWEMDEQLTSECSELIKKFDAVSVREADGVTICSKYLHYDKAVQVLDPTLLLSKSDYEALIPENMPKSEGNMLCYILDENDKKRQIIDRIAREKGLKPFRVNSKVEDGSAKLEERIQPSIESWLKGFKDAEFVVTDSFHACIFSIIFEKPFVVIGNSNRGLSRFQSLLSIFNAEDRLIKEDKDFRINDNAVNRNQGVYQELYDKSVDIINANCH